MKPEDLIPPFPRHDQRVIIFDRVWYLPPRTLAASDFIFPGWSHPNFFGNTNPVNVEYCSGNGAWIADKALNHPEINFIGVEKKFERVRKLWSKIKNLNLTNLIVLFGEASFATKTYFPSDSIENIFINFPDPWPKNRHAKNRLIQLDFVEELWRILKKEGIFTFVTDDNPYSEWLIEILQQQAKFQSLYPSPYYITDQPTYGSSYFEQLWRSQGRIIRYHQFKKY